MQSDDGAVQQTNDDASFSKWFAVQRGYWKDPYVKFFCHAKDRRQSPEISRGYYARVKGIELLLHQFIRISNQKCQVVNLGAGFDTTYWQLCEHSMSPQLFVEVDFGMVTAKKCQYIRMKKVLSEALQKGQDVLVSQTEVHASDYHLLAVDLRNVGELTQKLLATGLDISIPTFFLAECVLSYMDPNFTKEIIKWAGSTFSTAMFINYDPFLAHDRFGQNMQEHLKSRGCSLLGIEACPDLHSQKERYIQNGWQGAWSLDMNQVYMLLPREEVARIEKLDFLDEQILLTQLLQHYCLSCGYNDALKLGLDKVCLG
eukprot:Em0005g707a